VWNRLNIAKVQPYWRRKWVKYYVHGQWRDSKWSLPSRNWKDIIFQNVGWKRKSGQTLTKEEEERVSMMWNCAIENLEPHKLLQKQIGFIVFMGNEKFEEMPLEAQILKVADDYQQLINSALQKHPSSRGPEKINRQAAFCIIQKLLKLWKIYWKNSNLFGRKEKTYMRCINRAPGL